MAPAGELRAHELRSFLIDESAASAATSTLVTDVSSSSTAVAATAAASIPGKRKEAADCDPVNDVAGKRAKA